MGFGSSGFLDIKSSTAPPFLFQERVQIQGPSASPAQSPSLSGVSCFPFRSKGGSVTDSPELQSSPDNSVLPLICGASAAVIAGVISHTTGQLPLLFGFRYHRPPSHLQQHPSFPNTRPTIHPSPSPTPHPRPSHFPVRTMKSCPKTHPCHTQESTLRSAKSTATSAQPVRSSKHRLNLNHSSGGGGTATNPSPGARARLPGPRPHCRTDEGSASVVLFR